jgi:hypothetical protein
MTMGATGFERRLVRLPAGSAHAYDSAEWQDELVIVVCGTVELEGSSGRRWRFDRGAIFWLQDQPLNAIHNPTAGTTILMAVARPISSRNGPRPI